MSVVIQTGKDDFASWLDEVAAKPTDS